jgi:hypothetical protein
MTAFAYPFPTPTRLVAGADEFKVPSYAAQTAMQEALEADSYRVTVICDPKKISIYCTPYVATAWRLREIGGYVSSIPNRISALPWPTDQVGLRSIVLNSLENADWALLGLLNVRYVIAYHPGLLTNTVRARDGRTRELQPDDLEIYRNPAEVLPRAFLARQIVAKATISESAAALFPNRKYDPSENDVRQLSYAEGPAFLEQKYNVDGLLSADFKDQHVRVRLQKSSQPRYLILNERFHPGWRAWVDNMETPVFPTNVFMRGLVVPPGATQVRLEFSPLSFSARALWLYAIGLVLFVLALVIARRLNHTPLRRPRA